MSISINELWQSWYPFEAMPTETEINAHNRLPPINAIQAIHRARMVARFAASTAQTVHPNLAEIRAIRPIKVDHRKKIIEHGMNEILQNLKEVKNASAMERRTTAKESNKSTQRNIRRSRRTKTNRK